MNKEISKLKLLAIRRLKAAGITWANLNEEANQIVVFGSHAMSAHLRGSDLDILCIGNGKYFKSTDLHLIWIPENKIYSRRLLKSELGTHVAAYGKWIKGKNTWAFSSRPSTLTISKKRKNILLRLNALQRHWDLLLPTFRKNQLLKLRRDIQRYQLMKKGLPPVPKSLLDREWGKNKMKSWSDFKGTDSSTAKKIQDFLRREKITNF